MLRPRSAYQNHENPLQLDRLPDTSKIELDLPARAGNPEENRKFVRRFFWLLILLGTGIGLWETTYSTRLAPDAAQNWIFLAALTGFLYYDATISRRLWVAIILLFISAMLVAGLSLGRHEYLTKPFIFLVATLCAVRLAVRMTHFMLYLSTTAPTPKGSAQRQRAAWRWRYLVPFVRGPFGLDLFLFGVLFALLPAGLFFYLRPNNSTVPGFTIIAFTIFVCVAATLILELFGSFICGRKGTSLGKLWRGLWSTVNQWLTYDRQNTQAPGVFKSPLGTHQQRWRMAFAVVVMLMVGVAQYTGWWRAIFERWDEEGGTKKKAELLAVHDPVLVVSLGEGKPSVDLSALVEEPAKKEDFLTNDLGHHYLTELDSPVPMTGSHHFQFGLDPELEAQFQEKLQAAANRHPQNQKLAEEFAKNLGANPETGSYTEDQKSRDKLMEFLGFGKLLTKIVWYYPVIATALVPGWLFLAYVFVVGSRFAGARLRESQPSHPDALATNKEWDQIVERLRQSADKDEQTSVFMGVNAFDHTPVLVPQEVFDEHAHFLGDSGSGKTALGIAPLMTQLLRSEKCSIVVIDNKADEMSLFMAAQEEAEAAQKRMQKEDRDNERPPREFPFRWFTTELGKSTYAFNPLCQAPFQSLSLTQKTDLLTASMGLQYGTDYGRSYFSDANAELLRTTLERYPEVQSFRELAQHLAEVHKSFPDKKLRDAASHIRSVVNRLAETEAINAPTSAHPPEVHQHAIDFLDVFRRPQAMYFYLPSALGSTSNAEIARLALFSLLTAAKYAGSLQDENGKTRKRTQVYLVIDEFQRIVSHNLELFLQQARSMNIGVILANQTLADLETAGTNLIPSVRANCRYKQMFSVTDAPEQEALTRAGGEMMTLKPTLTEQFTSYLGFTQQKGYSISTTEERLSRLSPNDILLAGDHPNHSIVQIRRGAKYAQYGGMPFVLYSQFHIDKATYDTRALAPWPAPGEGTILPNLQKPADRSPPAPVPNPSDSPSEETSEPGDNATSNPSTETAMPKVKPPPAETGPHPLDLLAQQRRFKEKKHEPPATGGESSDST